MKELAAIADEATGAGLPFIVIGGLAVVSYGHPRSTFDADFLIPRRDLGRWKQVLQVFGYAVRHEQETFVQFAPPLSGMVPLDLMLVNDSTFDKFLREAPVMTVAGVGMKVAAPLHLVALKLHAHRHRPNDRKEQDLQDIVEIVRLRKIDIDSKAFVDLCRTYATSEVHEQIRQRIKS